MPDKNKPKQTKKDGRDEMKQKEMSKEEMT